MSNNSTTMRSCFVVWNNPEWHYTYKHNEDGTLCKDENGKNIIIKQEETILNGMTHSDMCQFIVNKWCETKKGRTAFAAYCISAEGLPHIHCVFECGSNDTFRYTQIQNLFGVKFHAEWTRGNKKQVEDYIRKQGKFEEKGEIVETKYQHGELKGNQGSRSDLKAIEEAINNGVSPETIFSESLAAVRYEPFVKKYVFYRRKKETPTIRNVKVVWHLGKTETGKSYYVAQLMDKYGEDSVCKMTDYGIGGFDSYLAQDYLVLEEFRGELKYSILLMILDKYKSEFHARYSNITGLWKEVHINSPLTPYQVYENMKKNENLLDSDSVNQLIRRINEVHYHYVTKSGEYKTYICKDARHLFMVAYLNDANLVNSQLEENFIEAIENNKPIYEGDEII